MEYLFITLFIRTATRRYKISDAYVMALSFAIFFVVGKYAKTVLKNLETKQVRKMSNPKGKGLKLEFFDDNELEITLLPCIADNEHYLVRNEKVKELIFGLVKKTIKNESLILTLI